MGRSQYVVYHMDRIASDIVCTKHSRVYNKELVIYYLGGGPVEMGGGGHAKIHA